jgi:hypothetical protein
MKIRNQLAPVLKLLPAQAADLLVHQLTSVVEGSSGA